MDEEYVQLRLSGNAARSAPNPGNPIKLQNMWDRIGGSSDPVRRNRKAQWKPNNVVKAV